MIWHTENPLNILPSLLHYVESRKVLRHFYESPNPNSLSVLILLQRPEISFCWLFQWSSSFPIIFSSAKHQNGLQRRIRQSSAGALFRLGGSKPADQHSSRPTHIWRTIGLVVLDFEALDLGVFLFLFLKLFGLCCSSYIWKVFEKFYPHFMYIRPSNILAN